MVSFNPNFDWRQFGGQALSDVGYGISQGGFNNGFGVAAERNQQLAPYRQQQVEKQQAVEKDKNRLTAAADALVKFGGDPRLADAVRNEALDPVVAWNAVLTKTDPDAILDRAYKQAQISKLNHPDDNTYEGRIRMGTEQGLSGAALTEYALTGKLPGGNQTVRAGVGQPIFGKNKTTGAVEPWQSMTDGTMVNIANPAAAATDYDFNPGIAAGERTEGTVDAKTSAAARAALPSAEQSAKMASQTIDALLTDEKGMSEQFGNTLGIPNQKMPAWPGTPMARFRSLLEQGQGQAFMQARIALKGGGQITDYEGARAEAAYSRMTLAAQNNNQSEFQQAAEEFQTAIKDGLEKLRATANSTYAAGSDAVTGGSLTYNPATGDFD